MMETKDKIIIDGVSFFYGSNRVIDNVNAKFKAHTLTAITGPPVRANQLYWGCSMVCGTILLVHVAQGKYRFSLTVDGFHH